MGLGEEDTRGIQQEKGSSGIREEIREGHQGNSLLDSFQSPIREYSNGNNGIRGGGDKRRAVVGLREETRGK